MQYAYLDNDLLLGLNGLFFICLLYIRRLALLFEGLLFPLSLLLLRRGWLGFLLLGWCRRLGFVPMRYEVRDVSKVYCLFFFLHFLLKLLLYLLKIVPFFFFLLLLLLLINYLLLLPLRRAIACWGLLLLQLLSRWLTVVVDLLSLLSICRFLFLFRGNQVDKSDLVQIGIDEPLE